MTFLNLFPKEMQSGDVWGEGRTIEETQQNVDEMTWQIHFLEVACGGLVVPHGCELHWPDRAPRRVYRPDEDQFFKREA